MGSGSGPASIRTTIRSTQTPTSVLSEDQRDVKETAGVVRTKDENRGGTEPSSPHIYEGDDRHAAQHAAMPLAAEHANEC